MKKNIFTLGLITVMTGAILSGCGNSSSSDEITVVSREDGSGTRGAFIELLGIEEKDAAGNKTDRTTQEAIVVSKTDVMLTQVAGNKNAIGYVSLGSLNDTVKAVAIDGAEATTENVKNGSYKVSRPFEIAVKGELSGLKADFVNYVLSKDGQKVVTDNKYISVSEESDSFSSDKTEGKLVIAGSSSVTPVMEKLVESYKTINPNAVIEIQQTDSTAGLQAVIDGTADIGMASRELKDSEKSELTPTTIAIDGIAVIVNSESGFSQMTSEKVKAIYIGEITKWSQVG